MANKLISFCICLCLEICVAWSQSPRRETNTGSQDTIQNRVHLLHVDSMYFDDRVSKTAQFLVGNVQFEHDSIFMYCDSALYYEKSNSFDAFGNVKMVQGDTLTLDGEILYYNGMDLLARVRKNVVLKHRETTLYTDSLDYDRLYNLGYFFEGGAGDPHEL